MCCRSHKIGMQITSLEGREHKKALAERAGMVYSTGFNGSSKKFIYGRLIFLYPEIERIFSI